MKTVARVQQLLTMECWKRCILVPHLVAFVQFHHVVCGKWEGWMCQNCDSLFVYYRNLSKNTLWFEIRCSLCKDLWAVRFKWFQFNKNMNMWRDATVCNVYLRFPHFSDNDLCQLIHLNVMFYTSAVKAWPYMGEKRRLCRNGKGKKVWHWNL